MIKFKHLFSTFVFVILFANVLSCATKEGKEKVWIYTSAYPGTVKKFDALIRAQYPDLDPQWFQNGSENVAAKIALERLANNVQADLVMITDIFWYKKMERENFWESYESPTSYTLAPELTGTHHEFTVPRFGAMVLAYNKKFVTDSEAPQRFTDLLDAKWQGKLTSGSPLESGTNYTLYINLVYKYGYDFLTGLKTNGLVSAGGNGAALTRVVSGERPVGLILLENLLVEQKKNPDLGIVYPLDGVVLAPTPLAIVKGTKHLSSAEKIYDLLISKEAQSLSVEENLFVPHPELGVPEGAKPWIEVQQAAFELSKSFFDFVQTEEAAFKTKFAQIVLNQ